MPVAAEAINCHVLCNRSILQPEGQAFGHKSSKSCFSILTSSGLDTHVAQAELAFLSLDDARKATM